MHERVCFNKATGKRHAEDEDAVSKRKNNVTYDGGAFENRLSVGSRNEEQNDIFALLKQSILQQKNKIKEELVKKNAIKFIVSLHTQFHLGMDSTFITEPPAILTTDTDEIFSSSNLNETLNNTI